MTVHMIMNKEQSMNRGGWDCVGCKVSCRGNSKGKQAKNKQMVSAELMAQLIL